MNSIRQCDKNTSSGVKYQEKCFLVALVIPPVFFYLMDQSDEPFSLINGISMWPAEFIKVIALWLSVYLLYRGWNKMREGRKGIEKAFDLSKERETDKEHVQHFGMKSSRKLKGDEKYIQSIWAKYRAGGEAGERRKRFWPVALIWGGVCGLLYLTQEPNVPSSDGFAYAFDGILTNITFLGFTFLFAFVSDATMHCRRFIQQLIDKDTIWPFMIHTHEDYNPDPLIQDIKREWYEIRLIGMRTNDISRTVYYPIYVILLLLAAQSDYFDNFDMPASLMLIATVNIFLVLAFSISLRRKAMEARAVSLENLRRIEGKILMANGKSRALALNKLRFYEKRIEDVREGAFLPITEQPWLRALTLMTGGGSSLLLLQYLAG